MNLYIDFDNVITNSSEIIVELLNEKYHCNKNFNDLTEYNFSDLFPMLDYWDIEKLFKSEELFKRVKIIDGFNDFMKLNSEKFEKLFVVTIGTKENLEMKRKFLTDNKLGFIELIGIENHGNNNKSLVDMSDGILIDDNSECLRSSNAMIKVLFQPYKRWKWAQKEANDNFIIVKSWNDFSNFFESLNK